jgi:hypothetical protein
MHFLNVAGAPFAIYNVQINNINLKIFIGTEYMSKNNEICLDGGMPDLYNINNKLEDDT